MRLRNGWCEARRFIKDSVAPVSAGIVGGEPVLDLDYKADSTAEVDLNVGSVGWSGGLWWKCRDSGEGGTFSPDAHLTRLIDLAESEVDQLERNCKRKPSGCEAAPGMSSRPRRRTKDPETSRKSYGHIGNIC